MRNIELKARLLDWAQAEDVCKGLGARLVGQLRQVDTYFHVPRGRLKVRECEGCDPELIYYLRPDVADAKGCDYQIEPVAEGMKTLLVDALGVKIVVRKVRSLHQWENVRIHLDHVADLGDFIEFEVVLDEAHDEADGHKKITRLRKAFKVRDRDLLFGSYAEMMRMGPEASPQAAC